MAFTFTKELPKDKIVVSGGRVQRHDDWVLWNGIPSLMIQVGREQTKLVVKHGEFFLIIDDPEHGGRSFRGTLDEVLVGLNEVFHQRYRDLFGLQNPTVADVRKLGFRRFEMVEQAA